MTDDAPASTTASPAAETPAASAPRKRGSFARELPFLVVVAVVLALLIKAFLVQAFYIPSGSMEQTLAIRDRVLVNKVIYRIRSVHRGEIVVFNGVDNFSEGAPVAPPGNGLQRVLRSVTSALGVGPPDQKDFIKRVIGIPGDRVACCTNGDVTVQPAGAAQPYELHEGYLYQDDHMPFCAAGTGPQACPPGAPGILVQPGRLWVLGDHRGASADSRFHIDDSHHGTVPVDKVIGRAFVVVWPVGRAKVLRIPGAFNSALGAGTLAATPYVLGLAGAVPVVGLRLRRRRARGAVR